MDKDSMDLRYISKLEPRCFCPSLPSERKINKSKK